MQTANPSDRGLERLGRARRRRLALALVASAALCSIQCTQITSFLLVDTFDDLADSGPGDGACSTAAGNCSLRAAIQEANARAGQQEIQLPPGFYMLNLAGAYEEFCATGDLDVRGELTIRSLGTAGSTVINAQKLDRVIHVHSGAHLMLEGVMVQGGYADSDTLTGAGIHVEAGAKLNLHRAMVNGNDAMGPGGGIYNLGEAVILRSTISHNHSFEMGGGLFNEGVLALSMSTVSTNEADLEGGGLGQSDTASAHLGNVTFNLNTAGGGGALDSRQGRLSLVNSILANSLSGDNCTPGAIISGGHNLSSDESCELEGTNDVTSTDPELGSLQAVAGLGLMVHFLLEGSPALGTGDGSVVDVARGDQLEVAQTKVQIGSAADFGPVLGVLGKLYVPSVDTGSPGGEVRIFSTVTHTQVGTIPLGDVRAAAVNPYGTVLFLARGRYQDNTVPNELRAYMLPALTPIWTVPLPGVPNAVAASGSSLQVYVVGSDFTTNAGYVTSINTGTAASSHMTGLDLAPLFIDADLGSTSSMLFITGDASGSQIRIYSAATETLLPSAVLSQGGAATSIAGGSSPSRMYVNQFGTQLSMLFGWFPATTPLGTLPKTVGPGDVVVHPGGSRVYAGDNSGVDVIDVGTGTVTTTISAGGNSLAVHPSGFWVYGGEPFSRVDVIQASSNSVVTTITVPYGQSVSKMAVQP